MKKVPHSLTHYESFSSTVGKGVGHEYKSDQIRSHFHFNSLHRFGESQVGVERCFGATLLLHFHHSLRGQVVQIRSKGERIKTNWSKK